MRKRTSKPKPDPEKPAIQFFREYGPELIGIADAFITMAEKFKANVEAANIPEPTPEDLLGAIRKAALEDRPFTITGPRTGLYGRRDELPAAFLKISKNQIQDLAKEIFERGEIVKCRKYGSSRKQWLDVPDGPYTKGQKR